MAKNMCLIFNTIEDGPKVVVSEEGLMSDYTIGADENDIGDEACDLKGAGLVSVFIEQAEMSMRGFFR